MYVLVAAFVFVVCWLAIAWSAMLTVSVIHANWIYALPTLDFKTALAVTFFPFLFQVIFQFAGQGLKALNDR